MTLRLIPSCKINFNFGEINFNLLFVFLIFKIKKDKIKE